MKKKIIISFFTGVLFSFIFASYYYFFYEKKYVLYTSTISKLNFNQENTRNFNNSLYHSLKDMASYSLEKLITSNKISYKYNLDTKKNTITFFKIFPYVSNKAIVDLEKEKIQDYSKKVSIYLNKTFMDLIQNLIKDRNQEYLACLKKKNVVCDNIKRLILDIEEVLKLNKNLFYYENTSYIKQINQDLIFFIIQGFFLGFFLSIFIKILKKTFSN